MHHPNNVKSLRKSVGLSAEALASRAGLCLSTIYAAEKGDHIGDKSKKAIVRGLGLSLSAFSSVFPAGDDSEEVPR